MGITDASVRRYLQEMLPARDPVLADIEAVAVQERIPIVGPVIGRLLEQLARMVSARRVFEMGSAVGYSTIWWARGVGPTGHIYYSDGSAQSAQRARAYLQKAGVLDRVELLTGNALDLIDGVDGQFDIVFIDIDKHEYPQAYRHAADRVRVGGLLVADNALRRGTVADADATGADTEGVREFNRLLYDDSRYFTTILPVGDGVLLSYRIG